MYHPIRYSLRRLKEHHKPSPPHHLYKPDHRTPIAVGGAKAPVTIQTSQEKQGRSPNTVMYVFKYNLNFQIVQVTFKYFIVITFMEENPYSTSETIFHSQRMSKAWLYSRKTCTNHPSLCTYTNIVAPIRVCRSHMEINSIFTVFQINKASFLIR